MARLDDGLSPRRRSCAMTSHRNTASLARCCAVASLALAAATTAACDPKTQIGAKSEPARAAAISAAADACRAVVGWKKGETPAVPDGLKIEAMRDRACSIRARSMCCPTATFSSSNPRRPAPSRSSAQGFHHGVDRSPGRPRAATPGRATASRCCATRRRRQARTAERLPRSPQLAVRRGAGRQRSLCRQYRCDRPLSLQRRATRRSPAPGTTLTPLPGGPIDHHWTKSLVASPDGSLLYVGVGSNSNITENGMEAEKNRAAIWEVDRATRPLAHLRERPAQSERPELRAAERRAVGRRQRARRTRPRPRAGLHDLGEGRRLLRLALQLLRPARRSPRSAAAPDLVAKAIAPDYALSSHVAPLGLAFYTGGQPCPRPIAAARSSASTAAGTGLNSMATRSCSCRLRTGIRTARPRMSSPASSVPTKNRAVGQSGLPSTKAATFSLLTMSATQSGGSRRRVRAE